MATFEELGINKAIFTALAAQKFTAPTPVQEQVIPFMLAEQGDLIGLAQTGTGKTAAFGIPLVQLTDISRNQVQGLVLCPTRELCVQVARDLLAIAKNMPEMKIVAVYGGASLERQIGSLRRGVHLIVATPGRLNDLIRRGEVDISNVRSVVLDEADEMLRMGFQEELNAILAETPENKNTLLFSATMPREVTSIADRYMKDPREIIIGKRNEGAENVHHKYYVVHAKDRYPALKRIIDINPEIYSIIFCRTRQETREIADKLSQDGYGVDALHGDLSQSQRDHVMNRFRGRNSRMLVATDVAARGLDVSDLSHVIHYNLPDDVANYTHRSGRTGRAGKTGTSIAIIHMRERHQIREIEKRLNKKFEQARIPTGREICGKQLLGLTDRIKQLDVDHERIAPFYSAIADELAHLDREDLIKRFISMECNRLLGDYQDAPDLNIQKSETNANPETGKPGKPASKQRLTRFFLNVGKKDGLHPLRLIGEINDAHFSHRIRIGKIEIMKHSSLLEADSRFTPQILGAFQRLVINGKTVSVEVAEEKKARRKETKRNKRQKTLFER